MENSNSIRKVDFQGRLGILLEVRLSSIWYARESDAIMGNLRLC